MKIRPLYRRIIFSVGKMIDRQVLYAVFDEGCRGSVCEDE